MSGQFYALSHRRIKFKELRLQFLDGLETALFKRAVTDSEGRFKLMVPIRGKHFLLANAAIEDGSKEKELIWLFQLNDEQAERIILSNNNLL